MRINKGWMSGSLAMLALTASSADAQVGVVGVRVQPVLNQQGAGGGFAHEVLRADGHRRFYEVEFTGGQTGPLNLHLLPCDDGLPDDPLDPGEDGCHSNRFFVYFSHERVSLPPSVGFAQALQGELESISNQNGRSDAWFEPYGLCDLPAPIQTCGLDPVFPDRLKVKGEAMCSVVEQLRAGAQAACAATCGGQQDCLSGCTEVEVGRACNLGPQWGERRIIDTWGGADWHLEQLGVQRRAAPQPGVLAPVSALDPHEVDLALIDTGISTGMATSAELRVLVDPQGQPIADPDHLDAHGTLMVDLMRDVAPLEDEVQIHSYRALDGFGQGTEFEVSQATDHALFDTGPEPLVINFSLGYAAEYALQRNLSSPPVVVGDPLYCAPGTFEDGNGAPLRYLLEVARLWDQLGDRRVLVVAATGNRPTAPEALAAKVDVRAQWRQDIHETWPWFFPAQAARLSLDEPNLQGWMDLQHAGNPWWPESQLSEVVLGVSAVNRRQARAGLSLPGSSEGSVVAPGETVYTGGHNATCADAELEVVGPGDCRHEAPSCPAPADYCSELYMPGAYSGSSISSALTAAAAAQAQVEHIRSVGQGLTAPELQRAIYLSGVSQIDAQGIPRVGVAGRPVRRLHVQTLLNTVSDPAKVAECVTNPGPGAPVLPLDTAWIEHCGQTLEAPEHEPDQWPGAEIFDDAAAKGCAQPQHSTPCGPMGCSAPSLDAPLVAGLGPQPGSSTGGCGTRGCRVLLDPGKEAALIEINPTLPSTTTFLGGRIRIMNKDGYDLHIEQLTTLPQWAYPGALTVSYLQGPLPTLPSDLKVLFELDVMSSSSWWGKPVTLISEMTVITPP